MTARPRVASPPSKPTMVFDGECTFCRRWIERWRQITGPAVDYVPFQELADRFPELSRSECERAVQLITADGSIHSGAAAVFRSIATNRRHRWSLWAYQNIPAFKGIADPIYAFIARHRMFSSSVTRLLWGKHVAPPQRLLVRSLFLKVLAITYLCAFISLWTQIDGLLGEKGILPAAQTVASWQQYYQQSGIVRYFREPSLCWISASDRSLHGQCAAGTILAALLLAGIAPRLCLLALWILYLSLTRVSDVFLGYQWDNLLLETGLATIFVAPAALLPWRRRITTPPAIAVWLLQWLLFRLMFASGCVKLLSGDETWHNLTALQYHYETQPLPTWLAWYAHHWPAWFHKFSCVGMFAIELVVPFLIFLPRRPKLVACLLFIALELGIAATGNYTFFNLLTIALCLLLLDDEYVRALVPARFKSAVSRARETVRPSVAFQFTTYIFAVFVVLITSLQLLGMFRLPTRWLFPLFKAYSATAPFRSINNYGLFAIMTTTRPEIIVEGSFDAKQWHAYEFKYKPGDLKRRPRFVAPHQPRLDWQMWFAALGSYRQNPWFLAFCQRLLEGSPDVPALMKESPFTNASPKYLRALVYDYKFTTADERKQTGAWWKREPKGLYIPVLTLEGEGANRHLTVARPQ